MRDVTEDFPAKAETAAATGQDRKPADKPLWEAPLLVDVSEQVMAQPYIRFT